jgi:hypothetical protein
MSFGSDEYIEFEDCRLVRSTEKAGLFYMPEFGEQWIPFSQVSDDSVDRDGHTGSIFLTKWICDQKEFDY